MPAIAFIVRPFLSTETSTTTFPSSLQVYFGAGLEIAFLFPWAVALKEVGVAGFVAVVIFLAILVVGFVYEWKKGALDWE